MSAEWLSAIAALATFLVILGSAIAALIQLRHMRSGNRIAIMLGIRTALETPEAIANHRFVAVELRRRLEHPQEARKIAQMPPFDDDYVAVRWVANYWEGVGAWVKAGLVDEDLLCDILGDQILTTWSTLAPIVTTARARTNSPALWENFEYAAVIAKRYDEKHPISYPKNFPRMPVDTSLADRIAQWDAE